MIYFDQSNTWKKEHPDGLSYHRTAWWDLTFDTPAQQHFKSFRNASKLWNKKEVKMQTAGVNMRTSLKEMYNFIIVLEQNKPMSIWNPLIRAADSAGLHSQEK